MPEAREFAAGARADVPRDELEPVHGSRMHVVFVLQITGIYAAPAGDYWCATGTHLRICRHFVATYG